MECKGILSFDYSKLTVYQLFKSEPFMTSPWYAEQWLVVLSICLGYCVRRFPQRAEFILKNNWL
jgi:hypothetical protein